LSNKSLDISDIFSAVEGSDKANVLENIMSKENMALSKQEELAKIASSKKDVREPVMYSEFKSQMRNTDYGGKDYWGLTAETRDSFSTTLNEALPWIFGAGTSGVSVGKAIPRYAKKLHSLLSPSKVLPNLKGYSKVRRPSLEGQIARSDMSEMLDVSTLDFPEGYDVSNLDFNIRK
tara:strand:+ start:315 stop:845 length:531 start_codon:yes stop_codon:yes gene_type:complete